MDAPAASIHLLALGANAVMRAIGRGRSAHPPNLLPVIRAQLDPGPAQALRDESFAAGPTSSSCRRCDEEGEGRQSANFFLAAFFLAAAFATAFFAGLALAFFEALLG